MSRLATLCVVFPCQTLTDGEYYEWYDGEGNKHRWGLCEDHLQLAIEMVECVGEVIDAKERGEMLR